MTDLLVIGARPSGLACALEAHRQGISAIVLDKGGIADAIRRFPTNLVWFSTPELLEIGDVPFLISTVRPTRVDTLNYYIRVVRQCDLDVRTGEEVVAVEKRDGKVFVVRTAPGAVYEARCVVIATGYFDHPARLDVAGEELPHVRHYYDEPFRYAGCDVAVIGGRNSAVEAALDLYRHGARVTLIHRGPALSPGVKYWILPDIENRIKAGQITALFGTTVKAIDRHNICVDTAGAERSIRANFVIVQIGYAPDAALLRGIGIDVDSETLAPACDPGSFETNIPGLFVAGSVVAGKNTNRIFVENGRQHGKPIVDAVAGYRRRFP